MFISWLAFLLPLAVYIYASYVSEYAFVKIIEIRPSLSMLVADPQVSDLYCLISIIEAEHLNWSKPNQPVLQHS